MDPDQRKTIRHVQRAGIKECARVACCTELGFGTSCTQIDAVQ